MAVDDLIGTNRLRDATALALFVILVWCFMTAVGSLSNSSLTELDVCVCLLEYHCSWMDEFFIKTGGGSLYILSKICL